MTTREILLKHVNDGTSERVKKLHEIVDWSVFISAMEEYAEQEVKKLNEPAVRHIVCPICECNKLQHEGNNNYVCLNVMCNFQGQIMP